MQVLCHTSARTRSAVYLFANSCVVLSLSIPPLLAAQVTATTSRADSVATRSFARTETLRLGEVYEQLRMASPRLKAAESLAQAARSRISAAGLPPDPQVQFGLMNYELPSLKPMDVLGMKQLQVMQMLPLGGKLGLSRSIARDRAIAQDERASDAWWEVRAQAAMPFYEMYRADQSLAVMRETLRLLGDIREVTEVMYRVGSGVQSDVLRAHVEIARMTEDTVRMQAMRSGMAARLNAILDRPQAASVASPLLPGFPKDIPSLDSLEKLAYAARPILKAGASDLSAAKSMEKLARKELLPDLQLGAQYGQQTMPVTGETQRMGSLMIGASIPIYARGRQLKLREEATAMSAMASADLAAMRADTRGALGERSADVIRSRRLADLYRNTIIPQSRAAVASAFAAYRVGKVNFMTLLDAQMTVNKYSQDLIALESEEGRAWADLEMLTGTVLVDLGSSTQSGDKK
jgi:cobalt-zinc-cadmium efflux system outer membrane protein